MWCKLYDIVEFIGGYAYKSNTYVSKSDYQVVRIGNVKNDFLNLENLPVFVPETIGNQTDKYRIYENDILFTMTGTKGKRDYFFTTVVKKQERILLLNQRVGCLRSFSTELNMNYLSMLLKGKYILDSIFSTETGNVSQGNIGSVNTLNLFVALPPYVEQQRIVKKVNSFFDLLNVMEERKRNLQDCIHDIKVKILDLAIQGKLIPQDSTDEPACDLLKRINPKAEIISDNGHYQKLPKGWCECTLGSLFLFIRNGINIHQDKSKIGYPITRIETISSEFIDRSRMGYAAITEDNYSDYYLQKDDILMSHINSPIHVGKCALCDIKAGEKIIHGMNLLCLRPYPDIEAKFILMVFRSPYFKDEIRPFIKNAVNQASINIRNLSSVHLHLPPVSEQHRIVAKIEEIFAQLDAIETSL